MKTLFLYGFIFGWFRYVVEPAAAAAGWAEKVKDAKVEENEEACTVILFRQSDNLAILGA